ncbi:hypothetical protein lerEdw1_013875 [Lerista edwardsae]|nr:hypothetical protein lerEdw1_013875 [Lerista edwardsae]
MLLYLVLSVLVLGTSLTSISGEQIDAVQDLEIQKLHRRIEAVARTVVTLHKARTFGRGTEKIYSTNELEANYASANATCHQNFARIPSPRSDAENRALQSVLKKHNKEAYIDRNSSGYSNWAAGQQNVADNKNCVKMNTNGNWIPASCEEYLLLVCEFPFYL